MSLGSSDDDIPGLESASSSQVSDDVFSSTPDLCHYHPFPLQCGLSEDDNFEDGMSDVGMEEEEEVESKFSRSGVTC